MELLILALLAVLLQVASTLPNQPSLQTAPNIHKHFSTCTVPAAGYEQVDDTPAINAAIAECGNHGTIVLPTNTIYSICTPLNLSSCSSCDIQLEGILLLSSDPLYWSAHPVIPLYNVHGATIRSLTGRGIIDGNAGTWYQRGRGEKYGTLTSSIITHISQSSSNITISNLSIKHALAKFFRQGGGSHDISYSNLNLSVDNALYLEPYNRIENVGFELGNTTHASLHNINVDFNTFPTPGTTKAGSCVGIDYDTSNIEIDTIYCNTYDGILVELETFLPGRREPAATVSNVSVRNYRANTTTAAGFRDTGFYDAALNARFANLTWDGVEVLAGKPVGYDWCYVHYNGVSGHCNRVYDGELHVTFEEVEFRGFKWANGTEIPDSRPEV